MKLLLCHNLTDPRFAFFAAIQDYLKSRGIDYVVETADADVAFYCANMGFNYYAQGLSHLWSEEVQYSFHRDMRNIEWLADRIEKIIVYIRDDGASLIDDYLDHWRSKDLLERVVVTKDFSYSDQFLNSISGRSFTQDNGGFYFHLTQILESFPASLSFTKLPVSQRVMKIENIDSYRKVRLFTWRFHTYGWLGQGYERDTCQVKDIDLFYVKRYRETLDGYYRKAIMNKVTMMSGLAKWTTSINNNDYVDVLCRSKIVVTPWGLGECVWDDWKASINGVLLLRPHSGHIQDYYGIYTSSSNPCLLNFAPDLSDFEATAEKALADHTHLSDAAVDAAVKLRTKYSLRQHADDFTRVILEI